VPRLLCAAASPGLIWSALRISDSALVSFPALKRRDTEQMRRVELPGYLLQARAHKAQPPGQGLPTGDRQRHAQASLKVDWRRLDQGLRWLIGKAAARRLLRLINSRPIYTGGARMATPSRHELTPDADSRSRGKQPVPAEDAALLLGCLDFRPRIGVRMQDVHGHALARGLHDANVLATESRACRHPQAWAIMSISLFMPNA